MFGLDLKVDTASLTIGIGIGIVAAVSVVFGLQSASVTQPVDNNPIDSFLVNSNRTHFFMSGHIKEITADYMVLDQTFGNPHFTDNPNVKVRLDRGAVFVNCYETPDPEPCSKRITDDQIAAGLFVCAHTRMYDGEFYAGKTWLNSTCGPFQNEVTTSTNESSVVIIIPEGSSLESSERNNFEPETITVITGTNNTVTWVNEDTVPVGIRSDNMSDPEFFDATQNNFLGPNERFTFTFTRPGIFGYHSEPGPWRQGTVEVLQSG